MPDHTYTGYRDACRCMNPVMQPEVTCAGAQTAAKHVQQSALVLRFVLRQVVAY